MDLTGYRRPDGKVGFRNHVLVLPTVLCCNKVAQKISEKVKGTISLNNNSGCGLLGKDHEIFSRTIINAAGNPNISATLVIGLGCERFPAKQIAHSIAKFGKPVNYLAVQDIGGTINAEKEGVRLAGKMVIEASKQHREPADLSSLVIGVKCGGSDPASGLTANPAVGVAVDKIIDAGGTAIIGEIDECIGAEKLLAANAINEDVGKNIIDVVKQFEEHCRMFGADLSSDQPSRGNVEAGLTTIEEKSLGCFRKIGSRPIVQVVDYAEIPDKHGPVLMNTPGFDVTCISGLAAGGSQIILFTTGLGTPVGVSLSPTIKISTNTKLFEKMKDNLDINCGTILDGEENLQKAGERIFNMIIDVCNGHLTKAEILDENLFSIWSTTMLL
jgi:altronate dehydratase large subunit